MKNKKAVKAAKRIRKYCGKFKDCKDGCIFYGIRNTCMFAYCGLPDCWNFEEREMK